MSPAYRVAVDFDDPGDHTTASQVYRIVARALADPSQVGESAMPVPYTISLGPDSGPTIQKD